MKRKVIMLIAALLLLVSVVIPASEARAAMMDATGSCGMTRIGKSVTFSGRTSSGDDEDIIRVTITLQEKRGSTWYNVSSKTKTEYDSDFASTSKTYTVTGGYYYRVYADHYSKTGALECTSSSNTESVWIPE